jgi:hypothetical protein
MVLRFIFFIWNLTGKWLGEYSSFMVAWTRLTTMSKVDAKSHFPEPRRDEILAGPLMNSMERSSQM